MCSSEEVFRAKQRWASHALTRWCGEAGLQENFRSIAEELTASLFDEEYGAMIRDMVQLPVRDPLLWANRAVDLGDGHWAITSIRFRGRDISKPFVDVLACSAPPSAKTLKNLAEHIMPVYEAFHPLCFRVLTPGPTVLFDPEAFTPELSLEIDQRFLAGRVEELNAQPRAGSFAEISLDPTTAEDAAQRVDDIHERLRQTTPELRSWTSPASTEELQQPEEEGMLFAVTPTSTEGAPAPAEPIGVVAAQRDENFGMTGFCVQEIALTEEFRGRGLGTAVLQHLCEKLSETSSFRTTDILWGTIHPDNLASLNNARSVGREEVAAYMWVTSAGFPGMSG